MNIKLKICGMNHNIAEVATLQPDYLGFIFYEKSPRFFDGEIPKLPFGIKKVGVFVNAAIKEILEKIKEYNLDVIQLHGEESPYFCKELKQECQVKCSRSLTIWKVFSIKDEFDFEKLEPFENVVDKFLFDTNGKEKGGNGITFDWNVLKNYTSQKPFILSGGIGLEEIENLKTILETDLPIHAIDVNSKFESKPGMKNVLILQGFQNLVGIK